MPKGSDQLGSLLKFIVALAREPALSGARACAGLRLRVRAEGISRRRLGCVLGIDYTPAVVERARTNLNPLRDKVVLGDFFTHDFGGRRFDVIYERTFLCAMPPVRWPAYVDRMSQLLVARGRLAGFFFFGEQSDPPPYPLRRGQQDALFADGFLLEAG